MAFLRRALMLLLLPALLALPVVTAAWDAHGQREPDTAMDAIGDRMWLDPPSEEGRLYFHAFPTTLETDTNPNVATLGTRLRPLAHTRFAAILGEWVDCNADGAIGTIELARQDYPGAILTDDSRCPPDTPHHTDGIVRELLEIGRGPEAWLDDPDARIWGDAGLPGAPGIETCGAYPLPRGTTANTGRTMRVLDCALEHRILGAINTVDNDGSLGLRVDDTHHPERSDSLLVQSLPVRPYQDPMTGRHGLLDEDAPPTFLLHDCSEVAPTLAEDPTSSSLWSAADREASSLTRGCETSGALSPLHLEVEQPFEPGSHSGRERNDVVLVYGASPPPAIAFEPWQQSASMARDPAVVPASEAAPAGSVPRWRAMAAQIAGPQTLTRGDLQPQGATFWTFYASVGGITTSALRLPSDSVGIYGAEACGDMLDGVRGGWACAAGDWWEDPAGDAMPTDTTGRPWGARVGDVYHLRDVDCLDGAVIPGAGIFASLAILSDEVCASPSSP